MILVTADARLTSDSYNHNKFSSAANRPVYQPYDQRTVVSLSSDSSSLTTRPHTRFHEMTASAWVPHCDCRTWSNRTCLVISAVPRSINLTNSIGKYHNSSWEFDSQLRLRRVRHGPPDKKHRLNIHRYIGTVPLQLQQGKSEGFDSCDRPSNLTQIGFKSSIFQPVWPWHLIDDLEKL